MLDLMRWSGLEAFNLKWQLFVRWCLSLSLSATAAQCAISDQSVPITSSGIKPVLKRRIIKFSILAKQSIFPKVRTDCIDTDLLQRYEHKTGF